MGSLPDLHQRILACHGREEADVETGLMLDAHPLDAHLGSWPCPLMLKNQENEAAEALLGRQGRERGGQQGRGRARKEE